MAMDTSQTYVIGDIHGMLSRLNRLLDRIPFRPEKDSLAFLGDYIDRGPDSKGVVDLILDLRARGVQIVTLRGNHEIMFMDYIRGRDPSLFLANGGGSTLVSYEREHRGNIVIPDQHLAFIDNLLPFYEMDDFILVHAGLRPRVALEKQREEDIYWIRGDFIFSDYDFGKRVIFGHTHFQAPYVDDFKIGIDTGAVYGNLLSCVRLPDIEFYSV